MTNTELSGGDAVLRVAVLEQQVAALEAEKARQQAVPSGWVPLLIEYDPGYPEEVAFGPQRMMDRLKLWLDKYFAMLAAAPQADSSPLLAKLDISGIGRDAGHPRAVLLYLRHEPSDDDLRTIQEMFRTAYPAPAPAPAERVEREPVAVVKYGGYAAGNHLEWVKGAGLQFLPEGTAIYAGAIPRLHIVAYLDIGAGGYIDLGSDLENNQLEALPWGRHMLGIVGTYGAEGYVPTATQPAPAPAAPDVAEPVEAMQLAFELGGLDDGSYHLDADELERVIRSALSTHHKDPQK